MKRQKSALAQSGHANALSRCPLLGVKQTSQIPAQSGYGQLRDLQRKLIIQHHFAERKSLL